MQLAVTLLVGLYVGYRLDVRKDTLPWFTLAGAAIGIVAGLYNFLKRFLKK
jgi:F0F1-type ATP synthase assembly protein I